MRSLVETYKDENFAVVGVNSDRELWIPERLITKGKVTWRSFQDSASIPKVSDQWQVDSWPTFVLIDRSGVIQRISNDGTQLVDEIKEFTTAKEPIEEGKTP